MRNLTINRTKSFVGCAVKMKIYIEDPASNELTINNVTCRKIGDLKNGEEKTFQIDDCAAKVFVIVDNLSKNYCNEYFQIPDGQEDIFLSGKNKLNPANGNAFRFDNNESEGIVENRKRGTRKGFLILAAAIIVGAVLGYFITSILFSSLPPEEKVFSFDEMNIILTDEFGEADVANYTVAYGSQDVAVFVLKEEFASADGFGDYTLEQYADLLIQSNNLGSTELKTAEGLIGFEYEFTNPETNDVYRYFSYVYKTDDAFWMIQFATLSDNVDAYAQQITKWAKTISFE